MKLVAVILLLTAEFDELVKWLGRVLDPAVWAGAGKWLVPIVNEGAPLSYKVVLLRKWALMWLCSELPRASFGKPIVTPWAIVCGYCVYSPLLVEFRILPAVL